MDLTAVRALAAELGALVLPIDCAGCGTPGRALCAACRRALHPAVARRTLGGISVVSGLAYDGPAREVLLALKNHGRTDLARPLAQAMRAAASALLAEGAAADSAPITVVPMPATRRSRHERGFDPVRLLLHRAGLPHRRLLALASAPGDQVLLGRDARQANLAHTMRASPRAAGARVLLVDDVVTTGATLREAARAVRAAGGEVVGAVTVATVPLRSSTVARKTEAFPPAAD